LPKRLIKTGLTLARLVSLSLGVYQLSNVHGIIKNQSFLATDSWANIKSRFSRAIN